MPVVPTDFFELGTIVRPHGVRGQVVVELDTDQPAAYKKLAEVYVQAPGTRAPAPKPVVVEKIQLTGSADSKRALLTLAGVTTMEAAEALRDTTLWLPLVALPPLTGVGQFYYHEIIGFTAIDQQAGELGLVQAVYELPQQDVLAIDHRGFEVLVPITDAIVGAVDRTARTLALHLPDGLLDIYTQEVKPKPPRFKKSRSRPAPDGSSAPQS